MTDEIANTARLMKVAEAVVDDLDRQGVAEALATLGFDPIEMAKAAEGDAVPFPGPRH
jgi:sulfur carrier protein ThiS